MADDDRMLERLEVRVPANRHMIRQWAKGEMDEVTPMVMPRFLISAAQQWVEDHDA